MLLASRSGSGEVDRIQTGSGRRGGKRLRSFLGPVPQVCYLICVENRDWLLQQWIRSGSRRGYEAGSWGGGGGGPYSGHPCLFRSSSGWLEKGAQFL